MHVAGAVDTRQVKAISTESSRAGQSGDCGRCFPWPTIYIDRDGEETNEVTLKRQPVLSSERERVLVLFSSSSFVHLADGSEVFGNSGRLHALFR
jgi:hypothetical protein